METKILFVIVIGNKFQADFGSTVLELFFETETTLTYKVIKGENPGREETVEITMIEIRPNVYMVTWQENDQTTVTHIEDFEEQKVFSSITLPDSTFITLTGDLIPIEPHQLI